MRGLLRPKKDSMSVFEDEKRSTLTPALSLREREKGKPALDLSPLPWGEG